MLGKLAHCARLLSSVQLRTVLAERTILGGTYIIMQISFTPTATLNTHGGPHPPGFVPGAGNHAILPLTHGQTGLALPLSKDILIVYDVPCVLPYIHSAIADSAHTLFLAP